jgi:hypothetical protein
MSVNHMPCKHFMHFWLHDRVEIHIGDIGCVVRACGQCGCLQVVWSRKQELEGVILGPSVLKSEDHAIIGLSG